MYQLSSLVSYYYQVTYKSALAYGVHKGSCTDANNTLSTQRQAVYLKNVTVTQEVLLFQISIYEGHLESSYHGPLFQQPIDKPYHVWHHSKELSFRFVIAHTSWGCYNANTKNIIVNTCTVCILENAKFQWKM